jgi:hypothetical protein
MLMARLLDGAAVRETHIIRVFRVSLNLGVRLEGLRRGILSTEAGSPEETTPKLRAFILALCVRGSPHTWFRNKKKESVSMDSQISTPPDKLRAWA